MPSAAARHVSVPGQVKPGRSLKQRCVHTVSRPSLAARHSVPAQSASLAQGAPSAPGLGAAWRQRASPPTVMHVSPSAQPPSVHAGAQNDQRGSSSAGRHAPAAQLPSYQHRSPGPAAPGALRARTSAMKSAWMSMRVCRAYWVQLASPDDATPTTCSPVPSSKSAGPPESPSHACDGAACETSRRSSIESITEVPLRRSGGAVSFATVQP
jgi:hypothetical protein